MACETPPLSWQMPLKISISLTLPLSLYRYFLYTKFSYHKCRDEQNCCEDDKQGPHPLYLFYSFQDHMNRFTVKSYLDCKESSTAGNTQVCLLIGNTILFPCSSVERGDLATENYLRRKLQTKIKYLQSDPPMIMVGPLKHDKVSANGASSVQKHLNFKVVTEW